MRQSSEQIKWVFLKNKTEALIIEGKKKREKASVGITIKRTLLSVIFHLWIAGDINILAYSSCIAIASKERGFTARGLGAAPAPGVAPMDPSGTPGWSRSRARSVGAGNGGVCVPSKAMAGQGEPQLKLYCSVSSLPDSLGS